VSSSKLILVIDRYRHDIVEFVCLGDGAFEENDSFVDGKVWVVFFLAMYCCFGGL
jgi:hypothetical protein